MIHFQDILRMILPFSVLGFALYFAIHFFNLQDKSLISNDIVLHLSISNNDINETFLKCPVELKSWRISEKGKYIYSNVAIDMEKHQQKNITNLCNGYWYHIDDNSDIGIYITQKRNILKENVISVSLYTVNLRDAIITNEFIFNTDINNVFCVSNDQRYVYEIRTDFTHDIYCHDLCSFNPARKLLTVNTMKEKMIFPTGKGSDFAVKKSSCNVDTSQIVVYDNNGMQLFSVSIPEEDRCRWTQFGISQDETLVYNIDSRCHQFLKKPILYIYSRPRLGRYSNDTFVFKKTIKNFNSTIFIGDNLCIIDSDIYNISQNRHIKKCPVLKPVSIDHFPRRKQILFSSIQHKCLSGQVWNIDKNRFDFEIVSNSNGPAWYMRYDDGRSYSSKDVP